MLSFELARDCGPRTLCTGLHPSFNHWIAIIGYAIGHRHNWLRHRSPKTVHYMFRLLVLFNAVLGWVKSLDTACSEKKGCRAEAGHGPKVRSRRLPYVPLGHGRPAHIGRDKLQTLVYDNLPSTTAVFVTPQVPEICQLTSSVSLVLKQ